MEPPGVEVNGLTLEWTPGGGLFHVNRFMLVTWGDIILGGSINEP